MAIAPPRATAPWRAAFTDARCCAICRKTLCAPESPASAPPPHAVCVFDVRVAAQASALHTQIFPMSPSSRLRRCVLQCRRYSVAPFPAAAMRPAPPCRFATGAPSVMRRTPAAMRRGQVCQPAAAAPRGRAAALAAPYARTPPPHTAAAAARTPVAVCHAAGTDTRLRVSQRREGRTKSREALAAFGCRALPDCCRRCRDAR